MPMIDDSLKAEVVRWSAFYEHRIRTGTKVIFHLEAFVAKFMRLYEGWVLRSCINTVLLRADSHVHSNLMGMDIDWDD